VRLDQVANVIDSVEDNKNISLIYNKQGGQPAINLAIMRQPGSNTNRRHRRGAGAAADVPVDPAAGREAADPRRPLAQHREAFSDIQMTMLITLALVVFVIFLFLQQRLRDDHPALALPFSILAPSR